MIDCSKCPERGCCCGIFPFDKKVIEKHRDKFQIVPEKEVDMGDRVAFITNDLLCVFLNRQTKLCMIYNDRPDVCKMFGVVENKELQCVYFRRSGNKRSDASKRQVEKHIDKMIEDIIDYDKKPKIKEIQ